MTALTFEDAAPVKSTGTGRKADPNPFEDIVKSIAGKKVGKNDNGTDPESPLAKKFTQTLSGNEDEDKTTLNRIRRQLQDAGNLCNPQVTVRVHTEPKDKKNVAVTFWTVKKQARPRTASTEQTDAVANPEIVPAQ